MKNTNIKIPFRLVSILITGCIAFFFGAFFMRTVSESGGMTTIQANVIQMVVLFFIVCVFISLFMIFQKQKNEKKLMDLNQSYMDLIANIQGGVITCLFDLKTSSSKTLYISDGWTELTGYTLEELNDLLGGNPQALVFSQDKESANRDYVEQTAKGKNYKLQYRIVRKDGSVIWTIDRGIITTDADGNIQNQSIITEVTEIKEKEERLWKLAKTDQLTGLCNKMASASMIQDILDMQKSQIHALMVLDVDNFKGINDSLGHIFGDTVLIEVSAKLKQLFQSKDVIGRTGGDEFIIFITDILSKEAAEKKADEVCATFRNTYVGENGNYKISCSIGVAFSDDEQKYQELFHKADIALYEAKTKGKDQYVVYSQDQELSVMEKEKERTIQREDKPPEKDSGELEMKERFFELLYGSVDFSGSINMVLALLGRIMDVGKVYVFENSDDNELSSNTYQWCADGIPSTMSKLQSVQIKKIGYLDVFDENGIFYCSDLSELKPEIRELWWPQNVRSLMQVAIKENGVICGFIGFDDFRKSSTPSKENYNMMIFAAKVIGIFILKKRAEEETMLYNRNKMEALDDLPNLIYVIDDSFHLHYMNNMTQSLASNARLGDFCYQAIMKRDVPCEGCPAQECKTHCVSAVISDSCYQHRMLSNASRVTWQGREDMILLCCQDITHLTMQREMQT